MSHFSTLFTTTRHYSHSSYYSRFATIRYSLFGFSRHPFSFNNRSEKRPGRDSRPYKLIFFRRENSMTFFRHFRFCGFGNFFDRFLYEQTSVLVTISLSVFGFRQRQSQVFGFTTTSTAARTSSENVTSRFCIHLILSYLKSLRLENVF